MSNDIAFFLFYEKALTLIFTGFIMSIQLLAQFSPKISWVTYQNDVPLLSELVVWNKSDQDYRHLTLKLRCSPDFIKEKSWVIDEIKAYSSVRISDLALNIDIEQLFALTESVKSQVNLQLFAENEPLVSENYPLEWLTKNEWGGAMMADLLPAFVLPNDPAVEKLVKQAGEFLRKNKVDDALNGYQSENKRKVWEMVSAAWSAVAELKLNYAEPPASFEKIGQKIRTPAAIMESRLATCLDSSLLFAAILEQMGLHSLLVLVEGHAFVGVWLAKSTLDSDGEPVECIFSDLLTEDLSLLNKLVDLSEIILFETTLVTRAKVPSFSTAIDESRQRLQAFQYVLDIHRARLQGIKPLSLTMAANVTNSSEELTEHHRFEKAPILPDYAPEQATVELDRFSLWQRKLLDLSTANRLLHLPQNAKSVRLVSQKLDLLAERLTAGKLLHFISQEQFLESLKVQGAMMAASLVGLSPEQMLPKLAEYADNVVGKGEGIVWTEKSKLEKQLNDLYLQAKRDLEEGGTNTLFLTLGFLKWRKKENVTQDYFAPLILLPLAFERKGTTIKGVRLRDDEIRFNLTLLEMLRQDFSLDLSYLAGELTQEENGLDVAKILHRVRLAIKDQKGFEVLNEAAVGIFSFAKYYMWQDLTHYRDEVFAHPLLGHLLNYQQGNSQFENTLHFVKPSELDSKVPASELFTPLEADSSQLAAVVASATGQSFVLDGPPGAGKSQTITNIIAHNLALGRRVLFVSEKKAALDVVYRRLEKVGLGDFCIELHSNKTSKADFLRQLERIWAQSDTLELSEWEQQTAKLQQKREKLNGVVQALHQKHENGLTAHYAIGKAIRYADENTPNLCWQAKTHNAEELAQLRQICHRLGLNYEPVKQYADIFQPIRQTEWSNQWQSNLLQCVAKFNQALSNFKAQKQQLSVLFPALQAVMNLAENAKCAVLVDLLCQSYGRDLRFLFGPTAGQILKTAEQAMVLFSEIEVLRQSLSVPYTLSAVAKLNLKQLAQDWQQASRKFLFLGVMARKKIARNVMDLAKTEHLPDIEQDLKVLDALQAKISTLLSFNHVLSDVPHWQGIESNIEDFSQLLCYARELHSGIIQLTNSPESLMNLRQSVAALVVKGNDLLAENSQIQQQFSHYIQASQALASCVEQYEALTAQSLNSLDFNQIQHQLMAVFTYQTALNRWCAWNRVRHEAETVELGAIIQSVETQQLNAKQSVEMFDVAYARWFASKLIDESDLLRDFISAEHQSDIETFRQLKAEIHRLSVQIIRAKCVAALPDKTATATQGSIAILKHELQKKARHKAIRQLCSEIRDVLTQFTPCMLMSPLSIAQYLPLDLPKFDLVIFDEASQITPWDAVGSIARGVQIIVVGDDKQMPPTTFFRRVGGNPDDMEDLESILDECLASGVYRHRLNWHYRSRHESLISFSNQTYYDGNLITFPSAKSDTAVTWQKVNGIYQQGKMCNEQEAEAVVAEVIKRVNNPAFIASQQSIGVIALNRSQQALIQTKLDQARKIHKALDVYCRNDEIEELVVKNLETAQGDERDLILLSIGFGPTEKGSNTMSMSFGALNKDGGKRRLNVALTRAREEMVVFSSFDPTMIDLNRTNAEAVRQLKHFLEFVERRELLMAAMNVENDNKLPTDFEEMVAEGLQQKGWKVSRQIGTSRFRVDIGVLHPENANEYLAGICCDGRNYQADSANDRDNVRNQVLNGLGWQLISCWALDWWIDKEKSLNELDQTLRKML